MNRLIVIKPEEVEALIYRAVLDAVRVAPAQRDGRLLTSEEVAELLGVSARSIAKMVRRDGLPVAARLGRGYRFRRSAVEAWVEQRAGSERRHTAVHLERLRRVRGVG